ncbi:hypothetical protein FACS189468_2320 [Spirochaetia bacterium]|nr:hypothetical protein FACS189468_2320 [Spirochaetia bacterium]
MNREQQGAVSDMPIEEKLALLPDTGKAYLRGYLDRALFEVRRTQDGNHICRVLGDIRRTADEP